MKSKEEYIAKNKKAYFDYEILEKHEAGIVLTGMEIKQLRAKNVQLLGSYVKVLHNSGKPELFAININISKSAEPTRTRKLLMHKKEINSLIGKIDQKKLTIIPLKIYLKKNRLAKILIGVARGKKKHDKRRVLKEKDQQRDAKRSLKNYY
jgi:SsrA-binding protein